jgi:hypothetical protein
MGLRIVTEKSSVKGGEGEITIEHVKGDGTNPYEELNSVTSKNMALSHATKLGLMGPGIGGLPQIMPLNSAGEVVSTGNVDDMVYRAIWPVRSNPIT